MSMERLEEIQQLEEDLADVSLRTARMLTAALHRHSLDDVLNHFGYTRDEFRSLPD